MNKSEWPVFLSNENYPTEIMTLSEDVGSIPENVLGIFEKRLHWINFRKGSKIKEGGMGV